MKDIPPSGAGNQKSDSKKQIVLVIDGKPVRKFYTSIFLQRLNYHVITAKTAEDGLFYTSITIPLVIIANIDLPDKSGAELLKILKKNRGTRDVPVIIYTSNTNQKIQKDCEQSGCAAYLRHPATLEDLYSEIQKATNKPRRFIRLDTYLDVTMGEGGRSSQKKNFIVGLSELGMFVTSNKAIAYGSVHPFTFFLPNAPGWLIKVEGQVVHNYTSKDKKQQGSGIKFLNIGPQEREFIKDFIRDKLMQGIAGD